MAKKKALGRGLGALIPDAPKGGARTPARASGAADEIEIGSIRPNPYQPRREFQEEKIEELAASIREHGLVQPVLVVRSGDGYQLVAGERRFRAAKKAGLTTIPAVVKDALDDRTQLELALIENIQREDLNPIEEALAYQQLHDEFELTQEEISRRVGKERSTVANFLRLLKLPDRVKKMVAGGQLSMGHARALASIDDRKRLEELADRVIRQGLNVRQTEELVAGGGKKEKADKPKDVFTKDAEEKLMRQLRTKVEISRRRRGGSVIIHYSSEDELIRLFEQLTR